MFSLLSIPVHPLLHAGAKAKAFSWDPKFVVSREDRFPTRVVWQLYYICIFLSKRPTKPLRACFGKGYGGTDREERNVSLCISVARLPLHPRVFMFHGLLRLQAFDLRKKVNVSFFCFTVLLLSFPGFFFLFHSFLCFIDVMNREKRIG